MSTTMPETRQHDANAAAHRPLFPLPVAEYDARRPAGPGRTEDAPGLVTLHGYCARWCEIEAEGQTDSGGHVHGAPIDYHGPFCESPLTMLACGSRQNGRPRAVGVGVVGRYTHGTYDVADLRGVEGAGWRPGEFVRVSLVEGRRGPDWSEDVFLPIGEARRLLAGLQRAVDVADGLV